MPVGRDAKGLKACEGSPDVQREGNPSHTGQIRSNEYGRFLLFGASIFPGA